MSPELWSLEILWVNNIGAKSGKKKTIFRYRYDVLEGAGLIYYCDDPLWLDVFIHQQCGKDPMETEQLIDVARVFGEWNTQLLQIARTLPNPLTTKKI